MDSVTWRVCDSCGRELPITMYQVDPTTGTRRIVCRDCIHRGRCRKWRKEWGPRPGATPGGDRRVDGKTWHDMINPGVPHPGTGATWTDADHEWIAEHVGYPVDWVAHMIGRTTAATRKHIRDCMDGLCLRAGMVETSESSTATI